MDYRISRKGGAGSFLCPPGHPNHYYSITGPNEFHAAFDFALSPEAPREGVPATVINRARAIMADAQMVCAEDWVRHVYGYFRNSYSPDGTDRNVSNAIITGKLYCYCKQEFYGRRGLLFHLRKYPGPLHFQVAGPSFPPEHHLGYLLVKSYFPEHTPRLDLIKSGGTYGQRDCVKCQASLQYEAKYNAWVVYPGGRDCPKGGVHSRNYEGE